MACRWFWLLPVQPVIITEIAAVAAKIKAQVLFIALPFSLRGRLQPLGSALEPSLEQVSCHCWHPIAECSVRQRLCEQTKFHGHFYRPVWASRVRREYIVAREHRVESSSQVCRELVLR